jgi:glycine C-acetyltransferase/8-amino-7-oxononanoate synthase
MTDELRQVDRTYVLWNKRRLSYFAGCDYFRLSSHPAILRALKQGLKDYGLNVAASRLTTGNHVLFTRLEEALAGFFDAPAALLTAGGYATNLIAAQALREDFSHVLIDAGAHVSLRDACRFFPRPALEFKHRDAPSLARQLRRLPAKARPLVLTDGVFARDGEIAPLREYLRVLPPRGMILLDDAHAAGVIGANGRGTVEHAGVSRRRIIQIVTLSKAFGAYGGAVLCERRLRDKIIARSGIFAGTTPAPLPLANAALAAMDLLRRDPGLRRRLIRNLNYIKTALRAGGIAVPATPVPVVCIVPCDARQTASMRRRLLAHGVFPSFMRYPGGPVNGYYRFAISSEHTQKQLDNLLAGLL